jgi:signal transduction histidine kinase
VDITERKKSENILIESQKMKSDFITTASHELRTPLNMMAVNISALAGGYIDDLPDDAIEDLKLAERSIQHMTSIVDELLDLSKIESLHGENSNNFKVKEESAREVICEVISEVEKTAHENKHCIKKRLDTRLNTIHINKTSFRQVLINLLNNAIKYTPENGGIIVKTELKDDKVLISVIDNGYGVPGWAQDKIFDKFYQADNILPKRYGKFGGMGIGLSVSKVIVEQHGGTLSFISPITDHPDYRFDDLELGGDRKGSAFIITLDHKKRGEQ